MGRRGKEQEKSSREKQNGIGEIITGILALHMGDIWKNIGRIVTAVSDGLAVKQEQGCSQIRRQQEKKDEKVLHMDSFSDSHGQCLPDVLLNIYKL